VGGSGRSLGAAGSRPSSSRPGAGGSASPSSSASSSSSSTSESASGSWEQQDLDQARQDRGQVDQRALQALLHPPPRRRLRVLRDPLFFGVFKCSVAKTAVSVLVTSSSSHVLLDDLLYARFWDNFKFLSLETKHLNNYLFAGRTGAHALPPLKSDSLQTLVSTRLLYLTLEHGYIHNTKVFTLPNGSVKLRAGGGHRTCLQF
jgi:hypothetical protein